MATNRRKKALTALAAFVAFTCSQVYVQAGAPNPTTGGAPQRLISARLTTRGGQPILVNGNSAASGGTIMTGATIETPDQVSATIDLGDAGVVELQPNSKIALDFDQDGNVRVRVLRGCIAMKKNGKGVGEVYTAEGASEKSDNNRRKVAACYLPDGKLGPFSAGAPGTGTGAGLSGGAKAGIGAAIAGGVIAAVLLSRGGNPSPH